MFVPNNSNIRIIIRKADTQSLLYQYYLLDMPEPGTMKMFTFFVNFISYYWEISYKMSILTKLANNSYGNIVIKCLLRYLGNMVNEFCSGH